MTEQGSALYAMPIALRAEAVSAYLRSVAAAALDLGVDDIDVEADCAHPEHLLDLFRPRLLRDLGLPVYGNDAPHCTSLRRFAQHLAAELEPEPIPANPVADPYEGGAWAWGPVERHVASQRNRPAAFVLSAVRSGSTLLRVMLAGHPALFSPPELHLLPFQSMKLRAHTLERLGYTWMRRGLLSALLTLEGGTPLDAERRLAVMESEDWAITRVYDHLQQLEGQRLLVDKTPTYAFHPEWLRCAELAFDRARYIHLVRHPNPAIESFVRMRFHRLLGRHWLAWDDNAWLYAEKLWTTANLHILGFLEHVEPARQLRVVYEELVTNPEVVGRRMCEFLGVPFDAAILSPYDGARDTLDYTGKGAAIGDVNFLRHSAIDASLAGLSTSIHPPQRLGDATQRTAEQLDYRIG